jgi:hypothetical protein
VAARDPVSVSGATASLAPGIALGSRRPRRPRRLLIRPRSLSVTAWSALAVLVLVGVALVLCSAHTALLSPDSVRPLPPALAGPLGAIGPDLHLGGLIVLFTLMCAAYGAVVRCGDTLPPRAVIGAVLVLHGLVALGPPLLSTDVFSYGVYGRMSALYHVNPYLLGPTAVIGDHWFPFVGAAWVGTPTAYGPAFTALSDLLAHLTIPQAALAYKLIAVAGSLLAVAGAAVAARRFGRDPVRAILFVGLNPVLVVYAVGGAHNDLIMLAALSWTVAALAGRRARTAGGLLAAAVAVKLTAGILLPFTLVARRDGVRRHPGRLLAGSAAALLIVGTLSTVLFGSGPLHLLGTLELIQSNGGHQSVPGAIARGLGLGPPSRGVALGLQIAWVLTVARLLLAVHRERLDWVTAAGWGIVALLVTSTFLLPWYVVWLLPFAALSRSRGLRTATLVLTAVGMTSL